MNPNPRKNIEFFQVGSNPPSVDSEYPSGLIRLGSRFRSEHKVALGDYALSGFALTFLMFIHVII